MQPLLVLVVDDEQPIAELIAEVLVDEGYQVRVCHDGASALEDIRAAPPDVVILDVAMPIMTGEELLQVLRTTEFATLPVIISSAGRDLQRFIPMGATAILPKPYHLTDLLDTIAALF